MFQNLHGPEGPSLLAPVAGTRRSLPQAEQPETHTHPRNNPLPPPKSTTKRCEGPGSVQPRGADARGFLLLGDFSFEFTFLNFRRGDTERADGGSRDLVGKRDIKSVFLHFLPGPDEEVEGDPREESAFPRSAWVSPRTPAKPSWARLLGSASARSFSLLPAGQHQAHPPRP